MQILNNLVFGGYFLFVDKMVYFVFIDFFDRHGCQADFHKKVALLEPVESKREVGRKLGADVCIDPIHEDTKRL